MGNFETTENRAHRDAADPMGVRRTALHILTALDRSDRTLDALLEEHEPRLRLADSRDRALLNVLTFGVLRWRARLDYLIAAFSRTPLRKIKPEVLNILRIGLFQIAFLDRIPVSAAVNTAVELTKTVAPQWVVRYVNAVLRSAAVKHAQVEWPAIETDPIAAIAARKSFPAWLVRRWVDRMGIATTQDLCDAVNRIPPLTLRTNTLKIECGRLLDALRPEAESAWTTAIAPEGIGLRQPQKSVAAMPGFDQGWFQVQDEAAQLVTWMLHPQPGERVLDACAGLGGKTGHIAQHMQDRGELLAVDRSKAKLARLHEQMQRMGFTMISSRPLDLRSAADQLGRFDRILLDAPCSGLGVLRRNPDAKWRVQPKQLARYAAGQLQLLESLANQLAAGGRMVYAVCSTEPEEGVGVVESFLNRHPGFELEDPSAWMPPAAADLLHDGMLQTSPLQQDMDGFFAASLRR